MVESATEVPRVSSRRFWSVITGVREMGREIETVVAGGGSGGAVYFVAGDGGEGDEGVILILLRSR